MIRRANGYDAGDTIRPLSRDSAEQARGPRARMPGGWRASCVSRRARRRRLTPNYFEQDGGWRGDEATEAERAVRE